MIRTPHWTAGNQALYGLGHVSRSIATPHDNNLAISLPVLWVMGPQGESVHEQVIQVASYGRSRPNKRVQRTHDQRFCHPFTVIYAHAQKQNEGRGTHDVMAMSC